jgi:hypothetical protein
MRHQPSIVKTAIRGAVAGAVATWVMNQVTSALYARESAAAREREDRARGGDTAYARAAKTLARRANVSLTDERTQQAGTALHWATGIMAGVKYAALRRQWPDVAAGFGSLYGFSFFVTMDELMNPLMGFTPGPSAFPWQAHARGLAGHAAFGVVAEGTLRLLDRD